jgi:hypothetical protein
MWDLSEIKRGVEDALRELDAPQPSQDVDLEELLTGPLKARVEEIKEELSGSSNHWAIFILPNGSVETASSDSKDEKFNKKLDFFKKIESLTGGVLLTSGV